MTTATQDAVAPTSFELSHTTLSGPPGSPTINLHEAVGTAPGGIPVYSNGTDETFTEEQHVFEGSSMVIGYKWQCVEFARRWLLIRKGLLLPQIHFAAHIFYLTHVYDVEKEMDVPIRCVRNGTTSKPTVDSLIIYPARIDNFVGHVGVITEVGDDYVCVADQNRFFHHWGDDGHSAKFDLIKTDDGRWVIKDPECECVGWVEFPGCPNREEGAPIVKLGDRKAAPSFSDWYHLTFFGRGFWEFNEKWKFVKIFGRVLVHYSMHVVKGFIWGAKRSSHEGASGEANSPTTANPSDKKHQ